MTTKPEQECRIVKKRTLELVNNGLIRFYRLVRAFNKHVEPCKRISFFSNLKKDYVEFDTDVQEALKIVSGMKCDEKIAKDFVYSYSYGKYKLYLK